jgi:hypothetical protein
VRGEGGHGPIDEEVEERLSTLRRPWAKRCFKCWAYLPSSSGVSFGSEHFSKGDLQLACRPDRFWHEPLTFPKSNFPNFGTNCWFQRDCFLREGEFDVSKEVSCSLGRILLKDRPRAEMSPKVWFPRELMFTL